MKTEGIGFEMVLFGIDEYDKTVALRDKLLRKPQGLEFTEEELSKEDRYSSNFFLASQISLFRHLLGSK